jgi:hypothetical protein
MLRIMKPGRQLVLAEMTLGPTAVQRAQTNVHLKYWLRKMLEGMQVSFEDLVYWGLGDLETARRPRLDDIKTFEWRGVELLWGRKPASEAGRGPEA